MLKCREMMKRIEKRIEGMSVSTENIEDLKETKEYMKLVAENVNECLIKYFRDVRRGNYGRERGNG